MMLLVSGLVHADETALLVDLAHAEVGAALEVQARTEAAVEAALVLTEELTRLAVPSASETLDDDQRALYQSRFADLLQFLDRSETYLSFGGTPLAGGGSWELVLPRLIEAEGFDGGDFPLVRLCPGLSTATVSVETAWSASSALGAIEACEASLFLELHEAQGARATLEALDADLTDALGGSTAEAVCPGNPERIRDLARLAALEDAARVGAAGAAEVEAELQAIWRILDGADVAGLSAEETVEVQAAVDRRLARIVAVLVDTTWDGAPLLTPGGVAPSVGITSASTDLGIMDRRFERADLGVAALGLEALDVTDARALEVVDIAIDFTLLEAAEFETTEWLVSGWITTLSDACGR